MKNLIVWGMENERKYLYVKRKLQFEEYLKLTTKEVTVLRQNLLVLSFEWEYQRHKNGSSNVFCFLQSVEITISFQQVCNFVKTSHEITKTTNAFKRSKN